jgi:hypothetical protein
VITASDVSGIPQAVRRIIAIRTVISFFILKNTFVN